MNDKDDNSTVHDANEDDPYNWGVLGGREPPLGRHPEKSPREDSPETPRNYFLLF